jgi:DNA-binding transcriptional MerR regulator
MIADDGRDESMCTVQQLAEIAGITVRTLHHYDQIGVLVPAERGENGFRRYGRSERLRLQQILFYRELDVPLAQIRTILDNRSFEPVEALKKHRLALLQNARRIHRLVATLDATVEELQGGETMLSDEQLYDGFTPEQAERYQREATDAYGQDKVAGVTKRLKNLSKEQWAAMKQEGDDVTRALAGLIDRPVADHEVQALIARHHTWLENFWHANAAAYTGLGQNYAEHPESRAFYEAYAPGLADFMRDAMALYAREQLE